MARAMWSGVVGFGMVSIPIKMYAATESKSISFHQLHSVCKTRIKEMRWCPKCERQVEWEEIVKGFEYSKGRYVEVTADDLEKLPVPSKNAIDVTAFVELQEIDPIYFERSYYLEPEKVATRPFALLCKALTDKKMIAIATVTLRTKERLCALRPVGDTLLLNTLLYPDEIRVDLKAEAPKAKISKNEMAMANSLIDLLAEKFDPEKYKDRYREALMEVIDAKLEGEPMEEAEEAEKPGKVIDLMDALKASIDRAKKRKTAQPELIKHRKLTTAARTQKEPGKVKRKPATRKRARSRGAA